MGGVKTVHNKPFAGENLYTHFYNLREPAFDLKPSTRFLYLGEIHKEALSSITYGVMGRKGFILLTGSEGTGKTTMVKALVESLDPSFRYVYFSSPALSSKDPLFHVALNLGLKGHFKSKGSFLAHLQRFLQEFTEHQQHVLLIIDNAHKLSLDQLEEIRLLSNIETADEKVFTILLVGQPELNENLNRRSGKPLLQRIGIRYHIDPLDLESTGEYIAKRLRAAGAQKTHRIFPQNTLKAIFQCTQGNPKMINVLAHRALQLGSAAKAAKITPALVAKAFKGINPETASLTDMWQMQNQSAPKNRGSTSFKSRWKWAAVLAVALALGLSLYTEKPRLLRQLVERVPAFVKLKSESVLQSSNTPVKKATDGLARRVSDYSKKANTYYKIIKEEAQESNINLDVLVAPAEASQFSRHGADSAPTPSRVTLVTNKDDTLTSLAIQAYGYVNTTIVDLLMRNNPEIPHTDRIGAGKQVFFPPLFESRYAAEYTVHIASYKPLRYAQAKFQMLANDQYDVCIMPIHIPEKGNFYRVTVGSFKDVQEAEYYARKILADRVTDYAKPLKLAPKTSFQGLITKAERTSANSLHPMRP